MNKVKLCLYKHETKTTWIDSFEAEEWENFVIISVDTNSFNEGFQQMAELFGQYGKQNNKQVIVISNNDNIDFYGVKLDDSDTEDNSQHLNPVSEVG